MSTKAHTTIFAILCVSTVASSYGDEPFGLRRDQLGMSLSSFKSSHKIPGSEPDRPVCSDRSKGIEIDWLLKDSWFDRAGLVNCSDAWPGDFSRGDAPTVAGVKTTLLIYEFVDEELYQIIGSLPHDEFSTVADALVSKYGKPSERLEGTVKNGFGASFNNALLIWRNSVSSIKLIERGTKIDKTILIYSHNTLAEIAERRKKTFKPNMANDL